MPTIQWESEAPAELATSWFGRSLTLPSNELVGQSRSKHVYSDGLTLLRPTQVESMEEVAHAHFGTRHCRHKTE